MPKLLVNAPSGVQEIIEIGEGGSYFEPERVLWDERKDGALPEVTVGGMVRNGAELVYDAELHAARPIENQEQIIKRLAAAVQRHMDSAAQAQGYDSIMSLCSYLGSSVTEWAAEAYAGAQWRDDVWSACKVIMDDTIARKRPVPTEEELIAELPALEWPR